MRKLFCFLCILASVAMVIVGITIMAGSSYSNDPGYASFGADFYTYSYKGTRAAALNIHELDGMLRGALGSFMLIFGLIETFAFSMKLMSMRENGSKPTSTVTGTDKPYLSDEVLKNEETDKAGTEEKPEPEDKSEPVD